MSGADAASPAPAPGEPDDATAAGVVAASIASGEPVTVAGDEPGSAADHWASTAHVRRSTHGHRTAKGASGVPGRPPGEE